MGSFSIVHWLIYIAVTAIWIVPLFQILGRIGWPRGLAFLALFPPAGLILFWCIAFGGWRSPGQGGRSAI
ncbi:hypothetical protein U1839_17465 [Sphingomonas sp. RT2P30]|uniref:hypothetical protein n=1 Tax=Parasphingomonas halimpatiens TaxID=3096162 RepID=UPI002FCC1D3F